MCFIISVLENKLLGFISRDWFKFNTQFTFFEFVSIEYKVPYVLIKNKVWLSKAKLFLNWFLKILSSEGISFVLLPLFMSKKNKSLFWFEAIKFFSFIFKLDLNGIL